MKDISNPSFRIRLARIADAPKIHSLLWRERRQIPLRDGFNQKETITLFECHCRKKRFSCVEMDGVIIGAMLLTGNEIFYLVVSPEYRRKKVANILVTKAKKRYATLMARIHLENLQSINFFEAQGFIKDPILSARPDWLAYSWKKGRG